MVVCWPCMPMIAPGPLLPQQLPSLGHLPICCMASPDTAGSSPSQPMAVGVGQSPPAAPSSPPRLIVWFSKKPLSIAIGLWDLLGGWACTWPGWAEVPGAEGGHSAASCPITSISGCAPREPAAAACVAVSVQRTGDCAGQAPCSGRATMLLSTEDACSSSRVPAGCNGRTSEGSSSCVETRRVARGGGPSLCRRTYLQSLLSPTFSMKLTCDSRPRTSRKPSARKANCSEG
mmetsp:Transcript_43617/g.134766  ORF Transcript_43617/g.134766 Transcript_43617/m.134766 type:complete len:232 (+) Transcript_43617:1350-2045(+)